MAARVSAVQISLGDSSRSPFRPSMNSKGSIPRMQPTAMPTEPPAIYVREHHHGDDRSITGFFTCECSCYTRTAVARVTHISVWDFVSRASGTPTSAATCLMHARQ